MIKYIFQVAMGIVIALIVVWLVNVIFDAGERWFANIPETSDRSREHLLTPSDAVERVETSPDPFERVVEELSPANAPRYIVIREGNSVQLAGVEHTASEQVTYVRGDIVDDLMIDNSRMALLLSRIDELVKKEMNTKKGEMNEQGGDKVQPEIR